MMNETDISLDFLLQETLAMTDYLRSQTQFEEDQGVELIKENCEDEEYLYDLADSILISEMLEATTEKQSGMISDQLYPVRSGLIYKVDNGLSTFCIRGLAVQNIREAFSDLSNGDTAKKIILKIQSEDDLKSIKFFPTDTFELAETIKEQVINRRFPHQEDAVCNISDPGFSWWMNIEENENFGRFEIFFRSHSINRAENCIQLGPIGDKEVAALRLNQARNLLNGSFPLSEYSCDEKSFVVETTKPDHSSFKSFMNIFKNGENKTNIDNFPDTNLGKTLFYYFHELAVVRKFWIEVKNNLC